MRVLGFLLLLVILGGCREARAEPITRSAALHDRAVREVRVHKVWDQVDNRLVDSGDPQVSHYIEVDILSGPNAGHPATFPYDRWNTGTMPPVAGDRVLMTPADWVARQDRTPGRPYGR